MSLKTELAKDRRNVASGKSKEKEADMLTCDVAESFFRAEILPFFYQTHFNKNYRNADQVRLEISFRDPNLYRVLEVPVWTSDPEKTRKFQNKIPFAHGRYNESLSAQSKDTLWSMVSELAGHEEWQIDGNIDLEKKELILTLDLT